jgi:hypothetical protein
MISRWKLPWNATRNTSGETTERYLHSNDRLKQQAVEKLGEFHSSQTTSAEQRSETPVSSHIIN